MCLISVEDVTVIKQSIFAALLIIKQSLREVYWWFLIEIWYMYMYTIIPFADDLFCVVAGCRLLVNRLWKIWLNG